MMNDIERFTNRQRQMVEPSSQPSFYPHVRLRYESVRRKYALLSPEKVFWPNDIALDIIKRCDGQLSVHEISTQLADEYDAPLSDVETDVLAFLQEWADQLLVKI